MIFFEYLVLMYNIANILFAKLLFLYTWFIASYSGNSLLLLLSSLFPSLTRPDYIGIADRGSIESRASWLLWSVWLKVLLIESKISLKFKSKFKISEVFLSIMA